MKSIYAGSLLAFALTGYGTAAQAQDSCASDIDELKNQLENEQISASLEQRINALLDQVEDSENCAQLLMPSNARPDSDQPAGQRNPGAASERRAAGAVGAGAQVENEARVQRQAQADSQQPNRAGPAQSANADRASGAMVSRQATQLDDVVVVSASGDEIGELDEILRSDADGEYYGVLEIGGLLGIGETEKLVALEDLEYDARENRLYMSERQNVEQLADYDEGEESYTELDGDMTVQVRARAAGAGAEIDTETRRPLESDADDIDD
jgi:hypothetical protein